MTKCPADPDCWVDIDMLLHGCPFHGKPGGAPMTVSDAVWAGLQRVGYKATRTHPHNPETWSTVLPPGSGMSEIFTHSEPEARQAALDHLRRSPALMDALVRDLIKEDGRVEVTFFFDADGHKDYWAETGGGRLAYGDTPYEALVDLWVQVQGAGA